MLISTFWGNSTTTLGNLSATSQLIVLPPGEGAKFRPLPTAGYFYTTIRSGALREVVKVTKVTGDTLTVERGLDNTTAQAFPTGSCLEVEWNPLQLCEFVAQCGQAAIEPLITPQTICTNCPVCIDIDAMGRIINVVGKEPGC